MLEARSLRFSYAPDAVALDGVDVSLGPGETVALLGPNGAGKSTLLEVAGGRRRPGGGSLRVLGASPPLGPGVLRRIGRAGSRTVHREALTGRENALFFGRAAGLGRDEARLRVDGLLERLDLAHVADDPVERYSRGMKRKLLLVEALAHDPALLLLDEPTSGLDPPGMDALAEVLRERADRGAAVLLASHVVERIPELADRIVLLHRGRVVADAAPAALLDRVGNRIEAELRVGGRAEVGSLSLPDPFRVDGPARGHTPVSRLRVSWHRDRAGVAELVGALADRGLAVRELRVREPDLGRVFRELTGEELGTDGATASRPGSSQE